MPGVVSPYEAVGTTYYSNRGFEYDQNIQRIFKAHFDPYFFGPAGPFTPSALNFINQAFSKEIVRWSASRTLMIADAPMMISIRSAERKMGMHKRFSQHNALFMDGHAETVEIVNRDFARPPGYPTGTYPQRGADWSVFNDRR